MRQKTLIWAMAVFAALAAVPAAHANLIVNGDFEASTSTITTPTGWTNIGHSDGVIPYSLFGTPAYDGSYFYDLGGFGEASGPVGDGIKQTVATSPGTLYRLTFGLSSEDVTGDSILRVIIEGLITDYPLSSTGTFLAKGFATQTIDYLALGPSTTLSFIELLNTSDGNNDPMIDGVIFDVAEVSEVPTGVPEPSTVALFGAVLLCLIALGRTRRFL